MPKRAVAPVIDPAAFLPAEIVAIAGAFKDDEVKEAKRLLGDGSSQTIAGLTVVFDGSVQKGKSKPDGTSMTDALVDLRSFPALCALLRRLGIGAKRLSDGLSELPAPETIEVDVEFSAIFEAEEKSRAARLPRVTSTIKGRAGSVASQITARKCVK